MDKSNNRILIITGGRIDDSFLSQLVKKEKYNLIIVADHGLYAADRLNLNIDYIIGDFDSVTESLLEKYRSSSTSIHTFPIEKDKTDTEIAIDFALMHMPTSIDIVGATGSRLDHVLANIHLLMLPLQHGIQAALLDFNNKIYLKNKSFSIQKDQQFGDYISFLPLGDKVSGLTLTGVKYPLNHISYMAGSSLGISNVIIEEKASIEFSEGILVAIESKD